MSKFSIGQLNQLGNVLEAAGWSAGDVTNLGQLGKVGLANLRDSLLQKNTTSKESATSPPLSREQMGRV